MKLSEMTTEKAFACMARMAPYVAQIMDDPQITETKEKLAKMGDELTNGDILAALCPLLMRDHREAYLGIVAAVQEKTIDEVKAQPAGKTFDALKEDIGKEMSVLLPVLMRLALSA